MPRRDLAGPVGRLEALLEEPVASGTIGHDGRVSTGSAGGVRAAVVLGHPHTEFGGTMHTKVVYQAAKALARVGCAVLRFNFRGAGASEGSFTNGPGEKDDFRAALDYMNGHYPGIHLWAAGMSFGSFVAMNVGAEDPRVTTLIGISPALKYDFEAVASSHKAKFFIQGEFDELCPLKDMKAFYARAEEPKELAVIDAADHLFEGKAIHVAETIEDWFADYEG
jgi:uncharacterized protein